MGLLTKFKQLFNKTICILPHQRSDMVSFVKLKNNMLKIGGEIIVDEDFNFVIVHFNKVCDVLRAGTYKVDEINTPKLFKYSKAFFTKKGIYTPKTIKTDAYFINLKPFRLNTFKTPERIVTFKGGQKIKIKLEGTFTLKVVNSEKFMKALCSDYAIISNKKAMKEIKATIGFNVSKILNGKNFVLDDYLNNKGKITEVLNNEINKYINIYGLEASEFFINSVIFAKKNFANKVKKEAFKQENEINIVKLVEERLNSLENSFVKIDKSSQNEDELVNANKFDTSINKKVDVRADVLNMGQQEKKSIEVFSTPFSRTPNTEMFNASNQKEPQLFEETKNNSLDGEALNEVQLKKEDKNKNNNNVKSTEEPENNYTKNESNKKNKSDVVNYFTKTKDSLKEGNLKGLNKVRGKSSKESTKDVVLPNEKKTKECKSCGAVVKEDAKFCSNCGKSTEELIVCPCCGAKNFPSSKTCCVCKSDL